MLIEDPRITKQRMALYNATNGRVPENTSSTSSTPISVPVILSDYEFGVLVRMFRFIDTALQMPKSQFYVCIVAGLMAWSLLLLPYDIMILNNQTREVSCIVAFGVCTLIVAAIALVLPIAKLEWYTELLTQLSNIHAKPPLPLPLSSGSGSSSSGSVGVGTSDLPTRLLPSTTVGTTQCNGNTGDTSLCGYINIAASGENTGPEFIDYIFDADAAMYDHHRNTGSGDSQRYIPLMPQKHDGGTDELTVEFGTLHPDDLSGTGETYDEWSSLVHRTSVHSPDDNRMHDYRDYLLSKRVGEFLWYNFGANDTLTVSRRRINHEDRHVYTLTRDLRLHKPLAGGTNDAPDGPSSLSKPTNPHFKALCSSTQPCIRCFYTSLGCICNYTTKHALHKSAWRLYDLETSIHAAVTYFSVSVGVITGMLITALVAIIVHVATPGSDSRYLAFLIPIWLIEMFLFTYRYAYHFKNEKI